MVSGLPEGSCHCLIHTYSQIEGALQLIKRRCGAVLLGYGPLSSREARGDRVMRLGPQLVCLLITVCALTGCDSSNRSGSAISSVIAPSSSSASPFNTPKPGSGSSLPKPDPAGCILLLGSANAEAGIGDGKFLPFGSQAPFYGAAKTPLDIDLCSGTLTGTHTSIQITVEATPDAQSALSEYYALVELTEQHTDPPRTVKPLSGIGTQASLLPDWLIAVKGSQVISATGYPKLDDQGLKQLALRAAKVLHWQ